MPRKKVSDEEVTENAVEETAPETESVEKTEEETKEEAETAHVEEKAEETPQEEIPEEVPVIIDEEPRFTKDDFVNEPFLNWVQRFYYKMALAEGQLYTRQEAFDAVERFKKGGFH